MKLFIVTGMSGAGKSRAADALEDLGYYCMDNVPPTLIPSLVDLAQNGAGELGRMAVITDIRGGGLFQNVSDVLDRLRQSDICMKVLFLDASDEVLIRRYKENRRKHPLCERNALTLSQAVAEERKTLSALRETADYVVDTSQTTIAQLKERLADLVLGNDRGAVQIQCKSFGFKYGTDTEADVVFDVRCLPNPFYIEGLKLKTGLDKEIADYVFGFPESVEFERRMIEFLDFAVPLYVKEGKSQLVIAMGCTGGKHRSVLFAERICKHLQKQGFAAVSIHRDICKK